jgi:predicted lipoprotein with Yx(FWY)xxD motif
MQPSSTDQPPRTERFMMRTRICTIGAAALFALTAAACSSDTGSQPSSADRATPSASSTGEYGGGTASPRALEVKASKSTLGTILTDQDGRTLYAFTNDKGGTSSCSGACIATWPAAAGSSAPTAGDGVNPALFSSITRTEGAVQAMYNKWPLYYYVGDATAGETGGQGVNGVWFVVNAADGKLIRTTP